MDGVIEQVGPAGHRRRSPLRGVLALAAVALLTLVLLAAVSELAARLLYNQSQTSTMACLVANDPTTGVRGRPNTHCRQQIFESQLIDYDYNGCGFRTPQPCGAAPAGTARIVVIGSSIPYAMHVQARDGFLAKLGPALAARTGRPIDIFNEGMQWGLPPSVALRTKAMLAVHPDMILWTLTPFDIENVRLVLPGIAGIQEGVNVPFPPGAAGAPEAGAEPTPHGLSTIPGRAWRRLIRELSETRTVFMLQHALFRSQSQYMAHTLTKGGEIDYLRSEPTPALRANLAVFDAALGRVAAAAGAAHVPLVVTLLPSRPQAIMLSNRDWAKGYDPRALGRLLAPIVAAHGGRYIDSLDGLSAMPGAGQLYFSVDEHLPPAGHDMLATLVGDALIKADAVPRAGTAR